MSQPNQLPNMDQVQLQQQQTQTTRQGTHVVHVRGDSDSQLENLFAVLNSQPDLAKIQQTPLRNRKLPQSFFEQPTRPSHSRENSRDSTYNVPASHPGLLNIHNRSQSSPAQLPLVLSPAPPPQPHHNKQPSVDFAEGMANLHIPPGPQTNFSQPRYFMNSQDSWPPKSLSATALNRGGHTPNTLSPAQSHTSSPSVSLQSLTSDPSQLPCGWEQGVTPEGEIYYINHMERTTSWFDPRIPKHLQRPGPLKSGQQPQVGPHQNQIQNPPQINTLISPQLQQQLTSISQQQMSPGQPQNSLPPPPQMPLGASLSPAQAVRQPPATTQTPQYIQVELERLKAEKDRLQREQEEIARREHLLKGLMSVPKSSQQSDSQSSSAPPTSIQSVSTSGVDPFLGQGSNTLESHARQNSGDSGLGGMGTSYSLPRTPEDFLSNVDEMDTQESGHKLIMKQQGSDMNMNDVQGSNMMDMGSLIEADQSGMESDDLVPSLCPDEISSLSSDLLNDVDKMENLLWL